MKRRLFEDLVVSRAGGNAARRVYSLPVSIGIHAAVVGVAVVLPMLAPDEAPAVVTQVVDVIRLAPVHAVDPTPPPAPRPPAPRPALRRDPMQGVSVLPHGAASPTEEPDHYVATDPDDFEQPTCLSSDCLIGPPQQTGGDDPPGPAGTGSGGEGIVVRPGGSITVPVKVKHVAPVYPELARRAGVQGVVIIECTIDPSGRVVGAQVLRGHPLLNEPAVAAVQQWVYRPTYLNGVPVSVIMTVTATFILNH
jgi:protein TonB